MCSGTPADDLVVDPGEFQGYASVVAADDGWVEVQRLVERGWIKQFESYSELHAFLGEDVTLSKFGIITKVKSGRVKERLILDAKASGISAVATKRERVILPRLLDVARNTSEMLARSREAELCLLDFADAFWLLPLAPVEPTWFTNKLRENYFVFLRNAQGSRNAPLG